MSRLIKKYQNPNKKLKKSKDIDESELTWDEWLEALAEQDEEDEEMDEIIKQKFGKSAGEILSDAFTGVITNNMEEISDKKSNSELYDDVSNVLDFIPIIGGANRMLRGQVTDGVVDWLFDLTGPIKYVGKIGKGLSKVGKLGKAVKGARRSKRYEKLLDKFYERHQLYPDGPIAEKDFGTLKRLGKRADDVDMALEKDLKEGFQGLNMVNKVVLGPTGKFGYQQLTDRMNGADLAQDIHEVMDSRHPIEDLAEKLFYYRGDDMLLQDPGNAFLLDDYDQEKFMEKLGYTKTDDDDGIKMIQKATDALTRFRLGRKPNIYQIGEDYVPRDSVIPIPRSEVPQEYFYPNGNVRSYLRDPVKLNHAGNYPTIFYKHINPLTPEYYYRYIDLNDYGQHGPGGGTTYGSNQFYADLYDFIGNPFIQKTGLQKMVNF